MQLPEAARLHFVVNRNMHKVGTVKPRHEDIFGTVNGGFTVDGIALAATTDLRKIYLNFITQLGLNDMDVSDKTAIGV